jgi:hypothetical protein
MCLADILQLWHRTEPVPITVGAAVHIGHIRFESDSLWDVAQSSAMRVLPGGAGPLKLKAMCTRVGAGAALASVEIMAGASQAVAQAGLAASDVGGGEVQLRLAKVNLPMHLCVPMMPPQLGRALLYGMTSKASSTRQPKRRPQDVNMSFERAWESLM